MRGKHLKLAHINKMWEFYIQRQSIKYVLEQCARHGISVTRNTVSKYVHKGDQSRGIISFRQRLIDLETTTTQVIETKMVMTAVADIDGWRRLVDQGMIVVAMLMDRAHEKLKPQPALPVRNADGTVEEIVPPLDAKDLRAAAEAVKVAFGAMKQAAETHDIWNLQSGSDADGRDTWLQENFGDFTPDEHAAFRDRGVWPSRVPVPEFMKTYLESGQMRLSGGEDEEEDE